MEEEETEELEAVKAQPLQQEGEGQMMHILELVRTRLPPQLGLPSQLHGEFRVVLGSDSLRLMMEEIGGHLKESFAPADVPLVAGIVNLELCLALAQVVASIPNLQILRIGGLPDGIGVQGGEQAMSVLFAALARAQASTRLSELYLAGHGAFGTGSVCRQLAHLLKSSHCKLVSLDLRRTGMSADGVRSIAEAMRSNTTLTHLFVGHSPEVGDAGVEHLSGMLLSNATLQELCLQDIGLTGDGSRHLCDALASPAVSLKRLDLFDNPMMGRQHGAEHLGNMLDRNQSLERLRVANCNLEDAGRRIGSGLRNNRTLTWLELSWAPGSSYRELGLGHLFDCFASNCNTALQVLVIQFPSSSLPTSSTASGVEMAGKNELALMLSSNRSLQRLSLAHAPYSAADWATVILPALGNNQGIKIFNCLFCPGIQGYEVVAAFLDLLRSNTNLEEIDLDHTPLKEAGQAEAVKQELQRNKTFRAALSIVPSAKPKSCRIVLCGKEYAGKSTVFQTLKRVTEEPPTGCFHRSNVAGQLFWQRRLRYVFGDPAHDKELSRRTRGIDILLLKDVEEFRICMWDFAGHQEFHALHDFIFPGETTGAATVFLFTFSPVMSPLESTAGVLKTHQHMTDELIYWLRFIVSNTRPGASNKPVVVVAITHKDRVDAGLQGSVHGWMVAINNAISRLAFEFREVVVVSSPGVFVNALDEAEVAALLTRVEALFRQKLSELPEQPVICDKVARLLGDPSVHHSPIITTDNFARLCRDSLERDDKSLVQFFESGDKGWRAVASYLHAAGEVIYHDQLNFMVRNPRWFGHGVLGNLIDIFKENSQEGRVRRHRLFKSCFKYSANPRRKDYLPKNGLVTGDQLKNLLQKAMETVPGSTPHDVQPDDLLKLMKLLDLCYEKNPGDTETEYLLPAIFEDDKNHQAANGMRKLRWKEWEGRMEYTGRRLECDDPLRTFLTAGFFPRLQVVLHNEAADGKWGTNHSKNDCILQKYLFSIHVNGMEIYVEYSGFAGYFVDILVKSSHPYEVTMEFVHSHIIGTIRTFCASQKGCQGVTLAEAVIRPACVKDLTLCAYRKDQSVRIDLLREHLTKTLHYKQSWRDVKDNNDKVIVRSGADDAVSLLSKGRSDEAAPAAVGDNESYPRSIRVSREDVGWTAEIRARTRIAQAVPFQLHLLCESRNGEHEVDMQPGRTFFVVAEDYAKEVSIRQFMASFSGTGFKAADSLIPGTGIGGALLAMLPLLDGTPVYHETTDFLMRDHKNSMPRSEWVEQLRIEVEKDLRNSIAGPWMDAFLNPDGFPRDFRLRKVVYNSTSATAWLCETHFTEERDFYRRVG